MKKLAAVLLVTVAVVAAAAAWVVTTEPDWYQRVRYPLRYEAVVRAHAKNYDLPPTLLAAVIYTESKFDADARSDAGAVGLMQLLPDTARGIAVRTGGDRFVVSDLLDPELNVRYGSWYLRHLLDRYHDVAHRARGVPRGSGQRRRVAPARRRDPVPGDAALRREGARRAAGLRGRLRRRARRLRRLGAPRSRGAPPACAATGCRAAFTPGSVNSTAGKSIAPGGEHARARGRLVVAPSRR